MKGGKVKYHNLSEDERKVFLGDFYDMISVLSTRSEVKNFFKDLLTLSEIVMISRRLQIAKRLLAGYSYFKIKNELKVGANNIAQVDRWLNNGFGGYKDVIQKYEKQKNKKKFIANDFSLQSLKKKYPAHFFLLNIFDKD